MTGNPYWITSETAPLEQVIVHTPGEELSFVSPGDKDELLFDDILYGDRARDEHAVLCQLFRCIVGRPEATLSLSELLAHTLQIQEAREYFVERLIALAPRASNHRAFRDDLLALDPPLLHRFALTGQVPLPIHATPLPNLFFTRDLAAVVGEHVVLNRPARPARHRESAIIDTVLTHHPRFSPYAHRLLRLPDSVSFEGGDLLVASEELVLIGQSERTTLGGVTSVARLLFAHTNVRRVLMVALPQQRSCMHLDTVFTYVDARCCVVFPPIIEQDLHNVFEFRAGDDASELRTRVWPNLRTALDELVGHKHLFIPCGGADPLAQEREQWTDGANLFAVAPNVVVAYERNQRTFEELRRHDFHVVDAEKYLDYYGNAGVPSEQRVAIKLVGHELSRGRGGPRCMTLPLRRAAAG